MAARQQDVLVIGGGLAGLAAASVLASQGYRVTICESRPRLGGRASSFFDPTSGETIDNCQHVGMGCCTNFLHFCRTVGIAEQFRVETSLTFVGPDGSMSRFAAGPVPAPAHLAIAFAALPYLSVKEKWLLAAAVRSLARTSRHQLTGVPFSSWLNAHRQTTGLIERFWEVIFVSALSESLDRIDAAYARQVIVDGFLANRHGWEVYVPMVPLDELYVRFIGPWLTRQGVQIWLLNGVERLESSGEASVLAARLRDGERLVAQDYVLAVPHYRAASLLPEDPLRDEPARMIERIESAPITSVHLWYDREITPLRHAVMVGRLSQWIFAKPESTRSNSPRMHGYQIVISASRHVQGISREELVTAVSRELSDAFPVARLARVLGSKVVTEHRAVFSPTPGIDQCRPLQQSPWKNLQLAGDWTRTGWPSTMESAVRSGYLAAQNILARHGHPTAVIQPDLPPSPLARLLLRLRN